LVVGLAAASVLLVLRFHRQVERAVDEESVPARSGGDSSVDAPPVLAKEEPTG
jgi:MATE family multidrug resistance protein